VLAFTVFMYGLAEILANRIPTQEEYVGLTPVVAILPWFLAGSLFPITALPAWLAWVARALPTTHVLVPRSRAGAAHLDQNSGTVGHGLTQPEHDGSPTGSRLTCGLLLLPSVGHGV
jgi:hypothetical protein